MVFKEAVARLFKNVYICRSCKKKIRADPEKIRLKKVVCPRCGSRDFRPKRKEIKRT